MELEIQRFLRNTPNALDEITKQHGINWNRHKDHPTLVGFKYDQLESVKGTQIVEECRGLILDESDNWNVVARPFDRFYNLGEEHAATIDWTTSRVQEKLDGSLMIVYFHKGWNVATSGMPDASGEVNGFGFSFAELFWKTVAEQYGIDFPPFRHAFGLPKVGDNDWTYLFELTSPYNRVVIPHKEARVTLLGVRNRVTGKEIPVDSLDGLFDVVKQFSFATLEDVAESLQNMDGLKQEGYIVVDANFNRVKIKNLAYVNIHHLRDGFGPRRVTEIVRQGETPEFLAYFPEWKPLHDSIKEKYDALIQETEELYEKLKGIEVQKDFALAVQASNARLPGALYALRRDKVKSVKRFIADYNLQNLMQILGVRDIAASI